MVDQVFTQPGWKPKPGDSVRVSNVRKAPEDHSEPPDVSTTYVHFFTHDPRWAENHCTKDTTAPTVYVSVFREKKYVLEGGFYWNDVPERIRLVKKEDANLSLIVSGIDDFWLEDRGDRDFVVLTNNRKGKKLIRFLLHRSLLPEVSFKLGILEEL